MALIPEDDIKCAQGTTRAHEWQFPAIIMTMYSTNTGIILCVRPANETHYIVTSPLIGWARIQNGSCQYLSSVADCKHWQMFSNLFKSPLTHSVI